MSTLTGPSALGATWPPVPLARYSHESFSRERLLAAKGATTVTVCIPARDEETTIGLIVSSVRADLMVTGPGGIALVDELLVVDDGSIDSTARMASLAGAEVLEGPGLGKGEAMRLAKGRGDVVVYLDGDVQNFGSYFVTGLLGPLLFRPEVMLVKGAYERESPSGVDGANAGGGGGRVTELVAKPLLSLLFAELDGLDELSQPLAGETAVRKDVLEEIELEGGYGVEIGLLIDVARTYGTSAVAEVQLGTRRHRNRPLEELAPQARQVMRAALSRSGRSAIPEASK